jgi:hypothetical protein
MPAKNGRFFYYRENKLGIGSFTREKSGIGKRKSTREAKGKLRRKLWGRYNFFRQARALDKEFLRRYYEIKHEYT